MTRRRSSPDEVRRIVGHALEHVSCDDCGAAPGKPCTRPGPGRSVHKSRYITAAIELRRQDKAERRTPGQGAELTADLAWLLKVSRAEIEKCRTPRGGDAFTRAWFIEHGLPYPPIAGWRQAVEREDGSDGG